MVERLERLRQDIARIQLIMVKVSTGENINDFEEEYQTLYFSIKNQLNTFRKEDSYFPDLNIFSSLWDFYSYWRVELKTYQERREYVRSLYKPIDDLITQVLMEAANQTTDSEDKEVIQRVERLERLKQDIARIQLIMVKVSTGENINDFEEEYQTLYFSIKNQLNTFRKNNIDFSDLNSFSSLWDFYSYWRVELKTYQERREYVRSLYKPIDDPITQVLMEAANQPTDSEKLESLLSSFVDDSVDNNGSRGLTSTISEYSGSALEEESIFEYDIALSFAGEDREIAENIANALVIEGVKVFYDGFHKSDMWGKKLTNYFSEIYGPKARFVMPLISKHYSIKDWTDFEFSIARSEAKKRKREFILPVKLDSTKVVGIHEDVVYLDYETESSDGIVDAVLKKLSKKGKKISKGIFVITLGVNLGELVENQILSEAAWKDYPRTCDKLEADLKVKLYKSPIGEYHFTEPSTRDGETLSVRFAHKWDLAQGLPDFSFTDWDILEFRSVEEIYPDSHKEVKSMFRGNTSE